MYFTICVCFKRPLDNNVSTTEVLLQPEPQCIKRLLFVRTRQSLLIKRRLFSTGERARKIPQQNKKDLQSFILLRWLQLPASHACIFVSWLLCLQTGVAWNLPEKELRLLPFLIFFLASFLFFRDETVSWLPHSDSLWEMHIVIKQFPVCKWPVYTFLLQSLSLDRLLEYEKHSHRMKNENSGTSIMPGKKIYCAQPQPEKRLKLMSKSIPTQTQARAHIIGRRRNEGYSSEQLRYDSLMEEEVEAPPLA